MIGTLRSTNWRVYQIWFWFIDLRDFLLYMLGLHDM
jgi:hypothetical protein